MNENGFQMLRKLRRLIPWQIKLVVLMLLMAVVPGLLISYSVTGIIRDELKSNINAQLVYSANSVSSFIDSYSEKAYENIELIKQILENERLGSEEKISFLVSSVEKIQDMLSLRVVVAEKNKFVDAIKTSKDRIRRPSGEYFPIEKKLEDFDLGGIPIAEMKLPFITTPAYNRNLNRWIAVLITSVHIEGLPAAYIVAQLDMEKITMEIENNILNRIGTLFLIDSEGRKFLTSRFLTDIPRKISEDAVAVLRGNNKITVVNSYEDSSQNKFVACFAYPSAVKWGVVANISEDSAYAAVNEAFIFFAVFIFASVLFSVFAAMLFSKSLSKPIIKMANVSESVAGGVFDVRIDYKADDSIGRLGQSLKQMGVQLKKNFNEIESQKKQLEDYSRNLEKKVEERTFQLSESNKELKKAYQRVLELNEEKNEFLGIAAHDLKNPLTAVSSFAEIIKEDKQLPDEQREDFLDEIIKASARMFSIVKNLLDVNAIEQGKLNTQMDVVSVRRIYNELSAQFGEALNKKELTLICEIDEAYENIFADYNLAFQVIQNILSNAIKFSPGKKRIFFRTSDSPENGFVDVRIKDEGPGFTEADKKKLFGKFARLSARPTGGEHSTGLGLSIVKKLVEMMEGTIRLESEAGNGAEFIITFKKG